MAEFSVTIQAAVSAKNLASATSKCEALKEWMARQGWELPEVRLKGQD